MKEYPHRFYQAVHLALHAPANFSAHTVINDTHMLQAAARRIKRRAERRASYPLTDEQIKRAERGNLRDTERVADILAPYGLFVEWPDDDVLGPGFWAVSADSHKIVNFGY